MTEQTPITPIPTALAPGGPIFNEYYPAPDAATHEAQNMQDESNTPEPDDHGKCVTRQLLDGALQQGAEAARIAPAVEAETVANIRAQGSSDATPDEEDDDGPVTDFVADAERLMREHVEALPEEPDDDETDTEEPAAPEMPPIPPLPTEANQIVSDIKERQEVSDTIEKTTEEVDVMEGLIPADNEDGARDVELVIPPEPNDPGAIAATPVFEAGTVGAAMDPAETQQVVADAVAGYVPGEHLKAADAADAALAPLTVPAPPPMPKMLEMPELTAEQRAAQDAINAEEARQREIWAGYYVPTRERRGTWDGSDPNLDDNGDPVLASPEALWCVEMVVNQRPPAQPQYTNEIRLPDALIAEKARYVIPPFCAPHDSILHGLSRIPYPTFGARYHAKGAPPPPPLPRHDNVLMMQTDIDANGLEQTDVNYLEPSSPAAETMARLFTRGMLVSPGACLHQRARDVDRNLHNVSFQRRSPLTEADRQMIADREEEANSYANQAWHVLLDTWLALVPVEGGFRVFSVIAPTPAQGEEAVTVVHVGPLNRGPAYDNGPQHSVWANVAGFGAKYHPAAVPIAVLQRHVSRIRHALDKALRAVGFDGSRLTGQFSIDGDPLLRTVKDFSHLVAQGHENIAYGISELHSATNNPSHAARSEAQRAELVELAEVSLDTLAGIDEGQDCARVEAFEARHGYRPKLPEIEEDVDA